MTRIPGLRDELVRAARRHDARPRWRSWRPFLAVTVLAVGVSGAALAATGTFSREGIDGPLIAKDPAASRRAALDDQVLGLINRANDDVFAARPRCSNLPRNAAGPRVTHDAPTREVRSLIAALRRPPRKVDRAVDRRRLAGPDGGTVYIDYVRVVDVSGELRPIVLRRGTDDIFRPLPGCLDAQHDRLVELLDGRSPSLRSAALKSFASFRRGQEGNRRIPRTVRDTISFDGGGEADAATFRKRGIFGSSEASGRPTLLTGLVPDGVATVTVEYPQVMSRGRDFKPARYPARFKRTVRVHHNVVALDVPRPAGDAANPRLTWRDAKGDVMRVVAASG